MCRKVSLSRLLKTGSGRSLKYCLTRSATSKADWWSKETPSGSDSTRSRRIWMRDLLPDFLNSPTWWGGKSGDQMESPCYWFVGFLWMVATTFSPGPDIRPAGGGAPSGCWEEAAGLSVGRWLAEGRRRHGELLPPPAWSSGTLLEQSCRSTQDRLVANS